ncbi:hypothetical protein NLU13_9463 [Sarocladium strictum]|uniref:Multiple myeloma tumor-associated protein 2-like N-terminal domain-containing protein n=1 Tax=Sarocladium strictum TaxID=5046 RepID=A0AA39L479_SARSR|nr:hypothetical protein NLU13_9463 [Sarocladium strictum]
MDLVSTVRKSGSRGGVNFSWDEVANSNHRENYLGHSLKAPVGRWQKGKDLGWYAKADDSPANADETDAERIERERKEELRRVKEAEEDAMAKALGLPPPVRNTSGANAIEVGGDRSRMGGAPEEPSDLKRGRPRRHRDSERREKHRHRSRSPSRGYDDRKPRRRHRDRSRAGDDRRHVREEERSARRDRHKRERSRDRRRSRSGERRKRSPSPRERRR